MENIKTKIAANREEVSIKGERENKGERERVEGMQRKRKPGVIQKRSWFVPH